MSYDEHSMSKSYFYNTVTFREAVEHAERLKERLKDLRDPALRAVIELEIKHWEECARTLHAKG